MANSDWRRYAMIVYDVPLALPRFYLSSDECRQNFVYWRRYWKRAQSDPLGCHCRKPLGIVHVRARDGAGQALIWQRVF